MRKIISFLGVAPRHMKYEFNGQVYEGDVFAEALYKFLSFDQMLVCVTEDARAKSWPVLQALNDSRIQSVPIPLGQTTAEMWGIFDEILKYITQGDTVIFDITHGLRSLPFLVFLFAAYLKKARKVTIEAIYYGAFELSGKNNEIAPVIDLSSFVSMLDWLTATDRFIETGDASKLSKLINPSENKTGKLYEASRVLETISQSASLCQPYSLMQEIKKLETALNDAESEMQSTARPFGILREQISDAFTQFESQYPPHAKESLSPQYKLILWYYNNGQIVQAVTLAREWLIDAVTIRLGADLDFRLDIRRPFEEAISGVSMVGNSHPQEPIRIFTPADLNKYGAMIYETWDENDKQDLIQLWRKIKKVRNVIDHAQHQAPDTIKNLSAKKILDLGSEIIEKLDLLAKRWNLISS
jgi:CRISPR-associated DxTHG motif protein